MSNTNTVYWDLGGTSLETYAHNVQTRGGSLRGTPSPRGDNRQVPFRAGKVFLPKYRDSRIITFQMWVIGQDSDGAVPASARTQFETNWLALANLFDFEGQKDLTRRWLEGMTVKSATAQCEYNAGLDPDMISPSAAKVSPSLLLADPWFYEAATSITVDGSAKTIRGSHASDRMTITFTGGTNPKLTVNGKWIQYTGAVGGSPVVIDVQERSATRAGLYVNGLITREDFDPVWMSLPTGSVTPTLTGGGSCTISYRPRWR